MKTSRFLAFLLCSVFCASLSFAKPLPVNCNEQLNRWVLESHAQYPDTLNLDEGTEALSRLKHINQILEDPGITAEDLRSNHWIIKGNQNPTKKTQGADQNLDFTELLLPLAHTGIYLPKTEFNSKYHKSLLMLLPGIGSNFSNAQTVTNIAKSMTSLKYNEDLGDTKLAGGNPDIKFRAYSIPVDMPLNGMATQAPGALASAEGTLAVARHVQLILMKLYPDIPVSIAGRSQGGLIAMLMAQRYGPEQGLHAAIAVNPSPTDLDNLIASVKIHETDATAVMSNVGIKILPTPWLAYRVVTPTYELTNESKAPTTIFLGKDDPSYAQATYFSNFIEPFVQADPMHRQVEVFSPPSSVLPSDWATKYAHDLWSINHPARKSVLGRMREILEGAK